MKKTDRRVDQSKAQWTEIVCPSIRDNEPITVDLTSYRAIEFIAFRQSVALSAVVANRFPQLSWVGESGIAWESTRATAMTAFGSYRIHWYQGLGVEGLVVPIITIAVSLPLLIHPLRLQYSLKSQDVGDVISDCVLIAKVWR